jgi:hypothetical protein
VNLFRLGVIVAALTVSAPAASGGATVSRFCGSQQSLLVREACRQIPRLRKPDVSDFETSNLLREWTAGWVDIAASARTLADDGLYSRDIDDVYRIFQSDAGGVFCWGAAWALMRVYEAFGFDSWMYAFGTVQPNPVTTHTVTLVRVGHDVLVQDPYVNYVLVGPRKNPLDVRDAIRLAATDRAGSIKRKELPVAASRDVLYDQESYDASVAGLGWLGNNWGGGDPRDMRGCVRRPYGYRCSVGVSYTRLLKFFWEPFDAATPTLHRVLHGRTPSQRLSSLITWPLGLVGDDGWIPADAEKRSATGTLLREIVRAARAESGTNHYVFPQRRAKHVPSRQSPG